MPSVTRSQFLPYGVAILAVLVALTLMLMLDPWLGMTTTPFLLFFSAVMVSAWYGGLKPGLLATLLSVLCSNYYFLSPDRVLNFDLNNSVRIVLFGLQGIVICALCEALRTAKRRSEANLRKLKVSEERLRLALSSSDMTIFQQDRGLRYQWIHNPQGLETAEEITGKTDYDLFPAVEAEKLIAIKQRVLESGVSARDRICLTICGETRYYDLIIEPLQVASSQEGIICVAVNTTERDRLLQREQAARATAEAMQQRLAFLDNASIVLASSLDYETTLQSVVDLTVPEFADLCSIDILQEDLSINPLVAVKAKQPEKADLVHQLTQTYPLDLNNEAHPITKVFYTGHSELLAEVTDADYVAMARDTEHLRMFRELGIKSAICVPLIGHEKVFGVLSLTLTQSKWRYSPDNLTLAEELGRRVGLAIENSRLHRQLQQAIQRQAESLALVDAWLASSPVALAFLDRDLRYIHVNEALAAMNGLPLSAHLNRTLGEVLPAWEPQLKPVFRQVMETKQPLLDRELSGETNPSGVYRHSLVSFYPVCLPDGQVLGVGVAAIDITQRKQIEASLRQREEELRLITNAIPALISYIDAEQRYCFNNQRYEQWFGCPATEVYGKHLWEVLGEDAYATIRPYVEQVLAGQQVTFESQVTYKNGGTRYISATYVPQFNDRQAVTGFVALVSDISDRQQMEAALQQSEERLRLAVESAELGMWDYDLVSGQLVWSKRCKTMFGLAPDADVSYEVFLNALHPEDRDRINYAIEQSLVNQGEYDVEMRSLWADGSLRWIRAIGRAYYNQQGEPTRMAGVTLDVTTRKQVEEALRENQERLRLFIEHAPAAVAMFDRQMRYLAVSRRWLTDYNLEDRNIIGRSHLEVFPDLPPQWQQVHQRCLNGAVETSQSDRFDRADGSTIWLRWEARPWYNSQNEIGGIVIFAEDITDRQQAQAEQERLLQQEQAARRLAELNIQRVSQLQRLTASLAKALTTAEVTEVLLHQGLSACNARRGWIALRSADGHAAEIVAAIGYQEEEINPYRRVPISTSIPITDAIRTRKMIVVQSPAQYRDRYPTIAEQYIASGSQAIVAIPLVVENRAIGCLGLSFPEPQDFKPADRAFLLTLAQQSAQALERSRLYEAERIARESAEAANRIKDEFLAVLSHELRSPLNPILGWSRLLRSRSFDAAATDRALETIERNAKLQVQLIDDLLDVSRILQGKLNLNFSPTNLQATTQAAIETVRLAAEAKKIQLEFVTDQFRENDRERPREREKSETGHSPCPPLTLSPCPLTVLGDAGRLQQIVWNLLSNAVKFTPAGGRVEVRLSAVVERQEPSQLPTTSYAQIQVSDTGKGIQPDFLPYVFDYFRQADSSTTRSFGGLGLGLAIVRHLVELHGCTVWAESQGEGQGATFTVQFPLVERSGERVVKEVGEQVSSDSLPLIGLKVLAVDDGVDMREYIACVLKQFGAEATVVASADEALTAFAKIEPDILLSDIGMPDVDGYMLLQKIRALTPEQGGQIPAIALTAYAGEYDEKQALSAGFQLHLPKPVEPDRLLQAIIDLIR